MIRVVFLTLLLLAGCSPRQNESAANGSLPALLEQGEPLTATETRAVANELFSITVPTSLREIPWDGDDSRGWDFRDEDITISTEAGIYAPDLGGYLRKYPEYWEDRVVIDEQSVKVVSYNLAEEAQRYKEPSKKYVVGVYFPNSNRGKTALSVSIFFRSEKDRRKAFDIARSIKFREHE